jgi:hypothetical protein
VRLLRVPSGANLEHGVGGREMGSRSAPGPQRSTRRFGGCLRRLEIGCGAVVVRRTRVDGRVVKGSSLRRWELGAVAARCCGGRLISLLVELRDVEYVNGLARALALVLLRRRACAAGEWSWRAWLLPYGRSGRRCARVPYRMAGRIPPVAAAVGGGRRSVGGCRRPGRARTGAPGRIPHRWELRRPAETCSVRSR